MLHVLDANGTEITDPTNIALINPLRYRGYYYDSELGLYYLNARYYDPETGRFINADNNVDTNAGLTGSNLFAYCANSSPNALDFDGEDAILLIDKNAVDLGMGNTAGHMGLALQDSAGNWYHFYYGPNNAALSVVALGGTKAELQKFDFGNSSKDKAYEVVNAKKVYGGSYTDSRYLSGDFSEAYNYIKNDIIGNKTYSAGFYNCKHTTIDALSKGNFGEYNEQYKEELALARRKNRPNLAFGAFTTFHDNEAIRKRRKLEDIHV